MPPARRVKSVACPDCGAALTDGVCPACALDALMMPGIVPTVQAKEGGDSAPPALDMDFGSYVLRRRLASGGMGVVYLAEHRDLKREVALKMIRGSSFANESERARFMLEAEAAAVLDHRNIIPIYEVGVVEEQPFFTMKFIRGRSLAERLKVRAEEPLSTQDVADWLAQIAWAVQHAHSHGVLHRDLKPGNILIDDTGKPWLMDFGLAKLAHADNGLTKTTDHLGTPNYMPPEIIDGNASDVSTASDVWALGVMLWEVLYGQPPFSGGSTVEIMRKIAEEEPARPAEPVDRDLQTLALRCMEKDPARRVASAGEFADELERWQRGEPLQVRRITSVERLVKWVRRKPVLAALYLVLLAGVISSLILWQHAERAVDSLTHSNDQLGQALAISTATKLAVDARVQVDEDPARALLLAVESIEQTEFRTGGILPEAVESLVSILQRVGGRSASPSPEDIDPQPYYGHGTTEELPPVFSPDGRQVLTLDFAYSNGRGVIAAISELGGAEGAGITKTWKISPGLAGPKAVVWTSDSRGVVMLDPDGRLQFWDVADTPVRTSLGSLSRDGMVLRELKLSATPDGGVDGIATYGAADDDGFYLGEFRAEVGTGRGLLPFEPERMPISATASRTFVTTSPDRRWFFVREEGAPWLVDLERSGGVAKFPNDFELLGLVRFSPDGKWLAMRTGVDSIRLYDLRSGNPAEIVSTGRVVFHDNEWIQQLVFSPDSTKLAVAAHTNEVHLIPVSLGGQIRSLRLNQGSVLGINFSRDSRWIAAGSMDKIVSVWPSEWQGAAPKPLELRGLITPALDVRFSPGGDALVAAGINPHFWQWDLRSYGEGAQPKKLAGIDHPEPINDLAISPDGKWFAAACDKSGEVKLIDANSRGEWVIGHHIEHATGVAFDSGGRWLASGGVDGTIKVWDMESLTGAIDAGKPFAGPMHVMDVSEARIEFSRRVAFHPRGTLYATCGDGFLFDWDLNADDPAYSRNLDRVHSIKYMLPDVRVSPDGRYLAVARHGNDSKPRPGETQFLNMVLLFDISSPGRPVEVAELPASFLGRANLAFSPDSRWLAASADMQGAMLWDLEAADIIASRRTAPVGAQHMSGLAFSPDLRTLALAGNDGKIHLWVWRQSGRPKTISTGNEIRSLVWIDETRLASAGLSGKVEIWETDVARLKELARAVAGRELSPAERRDFRIQP